MDVTHMPQIASPTVPVAAHTETVALEGITVQQSHGKITGRLMFKVAGVDMPWMESEEQALRVYAVLLKAVQSGYFDPTNHK
jgi:hypothetical protein